MSQAEGDEQEALLPEVPEALDVHPLLLVTLQCAALLELSDDETVAPDAAVAALERVGLYVQRLADEDLDEIEEQLERIAEHARQAGWSSPAIEFVERFLENCGIVDAEDEAADT